MSIRVVLPPSLGAAKANARAELLEAALARALDTKVIATVAASYADLEGAAEARGAEIVWAPAAVCARLSEARAVFTIVRGGRATYRSALVGRRDQGLTLETLAGARAAWVDPLSAGGYLLVAAMLRGRGVDLDRTFASQAFLGSHRAVVEAVLHDAADVTAVSMVSTEEAMMEEMLRWYAGRPGDRLFPIALTDPCPNDALVLTTALPAAEAARMAEVLVPSTPGARARSRLLSALEADGLARADLEDYRRLRGALLWSRPEPRRSAAPPARLSELPPPRLTDRPPRPR